MPIIDAHLHFFGDHAESIAMLDALDAKLVNICVAYDMTNGWREREARLYEQLSRAYPHRYAWCTSFSLPTPGIDPAAYARRCIAELNRDLGEGKAVACKVWKNVGMDLKDARGRYVLVDDPIFEPVFAYLEERGTPLLAHIAEPLACWQPLSVASPHQAYYQGHPQWHMYGRTDIPSHSELIAARDRVVQRHPRLTFIAAHLGSLEYSLSEMACRFDAWPNFFVDTSARIEDLMSFDSNELRAFLIRYQDRILFGTDVIQRQPQSIMSSEQRKDVLNKYQSLFQVHVNYFCSDASVSFRGRNHQGLNLPKSVCQKIMFENARRVYPGL